MEGRNPVLAGGTAAASRNHESALAIAPLFVAPFLVQFDICAGRMQWTQQSPLGICLTTAVALAMLAITLHGKDVARVFSDAKLLVSGFGLLATLAIAGSLLPDANFDEGGKYIYYPSIDALLFILTLAGSALLTSEHFWRLAAVLGTLALVASIGIDAASPGTFSNVPNRAAGFGVNPNTGGALVALMTIALLNWRKPSFSLLNLAITAVTGVGAFLTLSRSGMLTWGVINAYYVYLVMKSRGASSWIIAGVVGTAVIGSAASASEWARSAIPMLGAAHPRIEAFLGGGGMDHSDDSRIELAEDYFYLALKSPYLGWGTGLNYSEELGAHNIYIAKFVENGLGAALGLAGMFYATYRHGRRRQSSSCVAMAIFLFIQGFFTHNLLEDKSIVMMWAIVLGRSTLMQPTSTIVAESAPELPRTRVRYTGPRLAEAA